jgi:prepilin-type N-terminal cleavage/methylation domain-containing protein
MRLGPLLGNLGRLSFKGFSLVELIGVLAILTILAAVLIPRVMNSTKSASAVQTVRNAHVEEVLTAINAIKTACIEHCARFGSLASRNGATFAVTDYYPNYDSVLLSEQLLQRPFAVRTGGGAVIRLVNVARLTAATAIDCANGAYDLDGRGNNAIVGGSFLVEAVISGLNDAEATALNERLDGPSLGAATGGHDLKGRVTYRSKGVGTPHEVHIYITHR